MTGEQKVTIEGEYTTATVMTDEYDDNCGEQIQEMVNHPAFRNDVAVMPDTHYGAGAVIGFTMSIGDRVVPNTVGSDIGCGMYAINLGRPDTLLHGDEEDYQRVDDEIRDVVPMGRSVNSDPDYHIVDDFPWDECQETLEVFQDSYGFDADHEYGKDYFMSLCGRVGYDVNRAIASMGTLGGGNHFIELAQSTRDGSYWCVIHSGSRGIGLKIAKYWQERANEYRDMASIRERIEPWMYDYVKFDEDVNDHDLRQWVYGGMGESFYDMDAIVEDFEDEEIESRRQELKALIPDSNRNDELDWLEGEEAVGYFIDMIFAQKYASENRIQMAEAVANAIGVNPTDSIESTHNFVDFHDGVIRKGATRAHEGEKSIVPFDMSNGSIIVEGKGNPEWNYSVCHGAGRKMSRTQARNEIKMDDVEGLMNDVFSTNIPIDEAPQAYKDYLMIEESIEPTATVVDRLKPIINVKADE